MSTNGINTSEDAEMTECDGEKVVTMMDVLKEQEDFEEDANAVLGASDDKNCTYSKGYIKRQAIYACMTCCVDSTNDPTKWAGVCLACSLNCHENHELIELYTKRNFCCDCGNPKFNSHPCQYTPDKTDLNVENIYNQNFSGIYCVCHRPYPDPESSTQGDMIQCIICEDWLHSNHLDATVPSNEQYSEMICKACMDKNEFLHDYSEYAVNKENMEVDILKISSDDNFIGNSFENSNMEAVTNDCIENSNNDDFVSKETKNERTESNSESPNEPDPKQNSDSSDSKKEEQVSTETSNDKIPVDKLNLSENNDVLKSNFTRINDTPCESNIEDCEAIHKIGGQADKTNVLTETCKKSDNNEKPFSVNETPMDKKQTHDNRSQEQVDKDLLLADPVENELEQKKDSNVTSSETTQTSSQGFQKKSDSKVMDMNKAGNEDQEVKADLNNELQNEPDSSFVSKSSDTVETNKEAKNTASSEQSENVAIVAEIDEDPGIEDKPDNEHSECEKSEVVASSKHSGDTCTVEKQESVTSSEQSETACNEQSMDVPNIEQSENDSSKVLESVSELITQNDIVTKNNSRVMPMEENVTQSLESNNIEKDNSAVMPKDVDNSPNDETNNGREKPVNTIETDALKRKLPTGSDADTVEIKKPKIDETKCVRPKGVKKVYHGATFWPSNFRHKLCTCNECISMYKDLSVLFLIDPDDTVTAYERLGKDKTDGQPASQYEKGMAALSSLGRVQQINALTEYAKLRDKLLEFLKTFKDKKVTVKEEDIKAFFAGMKPVREPDGVYFCR